MIFGELPLAEARGAMLAHALRLGGQRLPKGSTVDDALIAAAKAAGVDRLWVARMEAGDVEEADAAARIAARLAGAGVMARPPQHGRVNLHATAGGLLAIDADAVGRANAATDAVAISTLPPSTPVAAGDMVATVKIIPYALPGQALEAILDAVHGAISVRAWQPFAAVLIQTRLDDTAEKLLAKTGEVTRNRLSALGIGLTEAPHVDHAVEPLARALCEAKGQLLLVAGATATSDRRDVIPAAIEAAGGTVERVGMPVDPGNLLVLGTLGAATVVGLPGCARSPKRNGLDLVLELLAAGLPVTADAITRMGVGGLLEESGRPVPWGWGG